jgi:ABC-type uncharacterized transport system permease subunit
MSSVVILQYLALALTAALFAAGFVLGLRHMKKAAAANGAAADSMGFTARFTVMLAAVATAMLLIWRAMSEGRLTLPLTNHFDAFLVLALLLAILLMYFRWTRHLRALSFFMLPMIAAMLVLGGILEAVSPGPYHYENIWTRIHIVTVVTGSVCFALACVCAAVYLMAARQLKHKHAPAGMGAPPQPRRRWIGFPPLASMEKVNQWMIYLGFPLLTIAMITGFLRIAQSHGAATQSTLASLSPKLVFAALAWLIYAVLLHLPLAPSFRGQRAAWLSIIGFVLFLGGYVAVIWMK